MGSSLGITAYLALFGGIGFLFVFVNLLIGRLVRPVNPHPEKLEIYECGEPTIGSSFVQFDLRFYVVALIFIVFDVEVAFLFPWATVFGKAVQLRRLAATAPAVPGTGGEAAEAWQQASVGLMQELGVPVSALPAPSAEGLAPTATSTLTLQDVNQLLWLSIAAAGIFFVVLLIGFAYEWRTGALDWVRAITSRSSADGAAVDNRSTRMMAREPDAVLSR